MSFECAHCGDNIPTRLDEGDGRVKRFNARFCSQSCKVDHHNLKRKIARKRAMVERLTHELTELEHLMAHDHTFHSRRR